MRKTRNPQPKYSGNGNIIPPTIPVIAMIISVFMFYLQVSAIDRDAGLNGEVLYRLVAGGEGREGGRKEEGGLEERSRNGRCHGARSANEEH